MEPGTKVYARRDIWLYEVYETPQIIANYVVIHKDEPGEVTDTLDDGRVWVIFEDDEWRCEKNMLALNPSVRKLYREGILIDVVTVFFIDDHGDSMGEIEFKRDYTSVKAIIDLPSFGIVDLAQDVFSALAQKHEIEFGDFVKLLKSLGYAEEEIV